MDNFEPITITLSPDLVVSNVLSKSIKRSFDVCFALGVILLVFPVVFVVVATLIKCSSPGPIFFKQKRTGRDGKEFICYKFRSMRVNKQADLLQATAGDARVTALGKFLRKSNLDEFPQFWNVLLGDMSIVGPRPHMLKHTEEFSAKIDNYMCRHIVKPGITGWAQVSGYRGEIRAYEQLSGRIAHDMWYISNWSFLLDIKIIFMTIRNIFKGEENAY